MAEDGPSITEIEAVEEPTSKDTKVQVYKVEENPDVVEEDTNKHEDESIDVFLQQPAPEEKPIQVRKMIADDQLWRLQVVPRLDEQILQKIAQSFEAEPVDWALLNPVYKLYVIRNLSPDLPLSLATARVDDEEYWSRRCARHWPRAVDVSRYGHSYRRMYFELLIEGMIENFVPGMDDENEILNMAALGGEFIRHLVLTQILPALLVRGVDDGETDPQRDHWNLALLGKYLPYLTEIRINYDVGNCGLNFNWNLFRCTINDTIVLASLIDQSSKLIQLYISCCRLDDARMLILVERALSEHRALTKLSLTYQTLRDDSARTLGRYLQTNKTVVALDIRHNLIGHEGGEALGFCLNKNSTLKHLNLRHNLIRDDGAEAFARSLIRSNKTLEELILGGNDLGLRACIAFKEVLPANKTLRILDLSVNNFSTDCGRHLLTGLQTNRTLHEMDLRLSNCSDEQVACIRQILHQNQLFANRSRVLGLGKSAADIEEEIARVELPLKEIPDDIFLGKF